VLKGTARERGRIHGESLKKEIREMLELSRGAAREAGLKPGDSVREIVGEQAFSRPRNDGLRPGRRDPRGSGKGPGSTSHDLCLESPGRVRLVHQPGKMAGSLLLYHEVGLQRLRGFQGRRRPSLIGQNADMGPDFDGYQTLLRISYDDSDLEELVLTCPAVSGSGASITSRSVFV